MNIGLQLFIVAVVGFLPLGILGFLDGQVGVLVSTLWAIAVGQLFVLTLARMILNLYCKCGLGQGPVLWVVASIHPRKTRKS